MTFERSEGMGTPVNVRDITNRAMPYSPYADMWRMPREDASYEFSVALYDGRLPYGIVHFYKMYQMDKPHTYKIITLCFNFCFIEIKAFNQELDWHSARDFADKDVENWLTQMKEADMYTLNLCHEQGYHDLVN